MKSLSLIFFILSLAACSRHPGLIEVDKRTCPLQSDFRGIGIGESESEALAKARSALALKHFPKTHTSNVNINSKNENHIATSMSSINIEQKAELLNPQDAHQIFSIQIGDSVVVVACMSKSDAAKPFLARIKEISDSLQIMEQAISVTEHPKQQNQIYSRAKELKIEFNANESILSGLGSYADNQAELHYERIKDDYLSLCKSRKLYWTQLEQNEYADIVFSILSKNLRIEKSQCQVGGIALKFYGNAECKYQFGTNNCQISPFLSIENCDVKEYAKIAGEVIEENNTSADYAKHDLLKTFKNSASWRGWETELKEWSPKCE